MEDLATHDQIDILVNVLKALHDREKSASEHSTNDPTQPFRADLAGHYRKLPREHLESITKRFKDGEPVSTDGTYLYLESLPKEPHVLPIMTFECKFAEPSPSLAFRVMLYHLDHQSSLVDTIGFRFETADGGRLHNYNHAQLINNIGSKDSRKRVGRWKIQRSAWLPEKQPAFPLDTPSSIGMVLCMLIALYGPDYLGKLKGTIGNRTWSLLMDEGRRMHLNLRLTT